MNAQKSLSPRAWAELVLLAFLWGGVFLAVSIALKEIGVMTTIAHRTFWAAVVLWGLILTRHLPVPRDPRIWAAFALMGLLNNLIPFGLLNWSQLHIESGLTAILNASTAVFGVLVAAVFFADERLTLRKGIGVALGFAGVVVIIGVSNLLSFDLRSSAQLAAILAAVSYAFAGVMGRLRLVGLHPLVAAAGMLSCSALVSLPLAWIIDGPFQIALSPATIAALVYYSVAGTVLAYLLYFRVLAMAGSGNLLLVTLLIPPVAILLGALVLGENLSPRVFAGFGLLALGLLVLDGRVLQKLRRAT